MGAAHRLDVGPGGGGHRRQRLQEIQRRAFGGQQRAGIAADVYQHAAGGDDVALVNPPVEDAGGVECAETGVEPRPAGDHGGLAADDAGAGGLRCGDQLGGQIAAADVFGQRARDIGQNLFYIQFRHKGLKSPGKASFS
ncbi:MAG: hypothetical protein ABT22_12645 [Thiobacillus sp. SCN 64-317]|nr:MAG: hypothetical protein ABT22_12645 [Thiobacillus sp. SCN 64-317]